MSSNERSPSSNEESHIIQGEATSVEIINPEYIEMQLQAEGSYIELLRKDKDDLPVPCREAVISYEHDKYTDEFSFDAHITFDPPETDPSYPWNEVLLRHIRESLMEQGVPIMTLPHHYATFYAQLDDTYAAQFSTREETHTCSIEMRIERLNEIHFELDENYDLGAQNEETPRFTMFRDFVAQWNTALSSATVLFGSPHGTNNITIAVPEKLSTPPKTAAKDSLDSFIPEQEQIMPSSSSYRSLEDIGGATEAKEKLRLNALAFKHPELAKQYGIRPSGFLLHGPAGTGKTSLVEAFASEIGAEFREFSSADIVSKWIGKSGQNIAKIFEAAKEVTHPLVLFFDEFDSLAPKGVTGSTEREDVKNIFKRELTALAQDHQNIIVATATNRDPQDFDEALTRAGRLTPIYVPIPDQQDRVDIWSILLWRSIDQLNTDTSSKLVTTEDIESITTAQQLQPYAEDIDPIEFAKHTEGMTGADINEILHSARTKKFIQAASQEQVAPISHADIMLAIRTYRKP